MRANCLLSVSAVSALLSWGLALWYRNKKGYLRFTADIPLALSHLGLSGSHAVDMTTNC